MSRIGKIYCHVDEYGTLTKGTVIREELIHGITFPVIKDDDDQEWFLFGIFFEYTDVMKTVCLTLNGRHLYQACKVIRDK